MQRPSILSAKFKNKISYTITCDILFSLHQIILMWNNEEIQNRMKIDWPLHFNGFSFTMEFFWLFCVTLFLLLCTFLLFCDFPHEFRARMPECFFRQRVFWKVEKVMEHNERRDTYTHALYATTIFCRLSIPPSIRPCTCPIYRPLLKISRCVLLYIARLAYTS